MADINGKKELSLSEFYEMLASLEERIENKMDEMKRSVITWKALFIVVLPLIAAVGYTALAHHEERPHADAATASELQVMREVQAAEKLENSNRIERFNENLTENSKAIERLSTAIEYAFPAAAKAREED